MRQLRSRIGNVTVQAPDFSLQLVPGLVVDLDKRLPSGGTLADQVCLDWFEPVAAPDGESTGGRRPVRRAPPQDDLTPASPAATEESHG